jgi:hypothetical protein
VSIHVFVDEVRRRDYVLCAAVVPADDVARARRIMRELKPGNRRRLHMHDEGAASRRRILAEFRRSEPVAAAHLWIARIGGRPERAVRDECFRSLVPGVLELGATRIVVESCAQDARDRAMIGDVLASRGAIATVRCDVIPAATDELLWAADVVAWAYGAGGEYRRSIADLVTVNRVP